MAKVKSKSAKIIGSGLAILQHNFDKLFEWGFKEMKDKSAKKNRKKECKVMKALRKVGGFLGIMGEEYYKKYEDLKKKDS